MGSPTLLGKGIFRSLESLSRPLALGPGRLAICHWAITCSLSAPVGSRAWAAMCVASVPPRHASQKAWRQRRCGACATAPHRIYGPPKHNTKLCTSTAGVSAQHTRHQRQRPSSNCSRQLRLLAAGVSSRGGASFQLCSAGVVVGGGCFLLFLQLTASVVSTLTTEYNSSPARSA